MQWTNFQKAHMTRLRLCTMSSKMWQHKFWSLNNSCQSPLHQEGANQVPTDYIYSPSKEVIVEELIPKSLKIQLYKAVLESNASEHGARMTAMDKATENAGDLLKDLKLTYNRTRQAAITTGDSGNCWWCRSTCLTIKIFNIFEP